MYRIWNVIKRDASKVTSNVISLIVCMGLVIIPSMYAWFNTEGSWDPYTNTKNLKVAVANTDKGYSSDLMPMNINIGEQVVSSLRSNTHIGYVITDKDDALDGIKSGKYYASIIIPEDFSRCLMTAFSKDAHPADLIYYNNEKENAIASIVTDKASSAVRQEIDESFAQTISQIAASTLSTFTKYMDSDQIQNFALRLDTTLQTSSSNISQTATTLRSYAELIGSVEDVLGSSSAMLSHTSSTSQKTAESINKTKDAIVSGQKALTSSTESVNKAINSSVSSFDDVEKYVDEAFSEAKGDTEYASSILIKQADQIHKTNEGFKEIQALLNKFNKKVESLDNAIERLDSLEKSLRDASQEIINKTNDIDTKHQAVKDSIHNAKKSIITLEDKYQKELMQNIDSLNSKLDTTSASALEVSQKVDASIVQIEKATTATSQDLVTIRKTLLQSADELDNGAHKLNEFKDKLHQAAQSNDVEKIRTILSSNPTDLASFISTPVGLERRAIYPVHNNGSAMAPFYTTLSLWVGATVLVAIVKVQPSKEALEETKAKPRHAYFGRLAFFVIMALLQATLVGLGNLFYLQIQCENPMLMMVTCWFSSFIYMNIIYALTVAFGDVGKAIAVLLLVIQVAGSGGTFPPEMLPPFFQTLYPFLPFVHTMAALRAAIAGVYGSEFIISLALLASFLIPSLILGLVLRKPVIRLNEWIEHNLESTKIM